MTLIGVLGFTWLGVALVRRALRLSGLRGKQADTMQRAGQLSRQPLVTSETSARKVNQGLSLSYVSMEISITTIEVRG